MKLIFYLKINMKVFYKLPWHAQSTQNDKLAKSLQYLKENVQDEVVFLPSDKYQRFLQIDTVFSVCAARHAQINQNNKCALSLQYLKKEVNDEFEFLHGDKHESFLQIDTMTFDRDGQAFSNFRKQQVLKQQNTSVRVKVDFLHVDNTG